MKVQFNKDNSMSFIFGDGDSVRYIVNVWYNSSGIHFEYYSENFSNNQYYFGVNKPSKEGIERLARNGIRFKSCI